MRIFAIQNFLKFALKLETKKEIVDILQSALKDGHITEDYFEAMDPSEKTAGKYYQLFKIHKEHTPPNLPPGRPIVSGCGSLTEKISQFVDAHVKDLVKDVPSYIQDTPDLLRHLEGFKNLKLPKGTFPVSIDVVGLYNNIPNEEGLRAFEEALEKRQDKTVPTSLLVELKRIVLTRNILEFDRKLYLQKIGTAMGAPSAPSYANLYMAVVDIWLESCALDEQTLENFIIFLKRFIDDFLIFWTGTEEQLLAFMTRINNIHPTIKFTSSYNLKERSTNFLDLKITITDNGIETDLYRKETDCIQYLLPTSCHPAHVFNNIPFSLALRLVRICSNTETLKGRFKDLKAMLITRGYNKNVIDGAIKKASEIKRSDALIRVTKVKTERAVLAITYNPMLPSITQIVTKHWRSMIKNRHIHEIFPQPPMVAYKQSPNLKQVLCRARLQCTTRPQRQKIGMLKCTKSCNVCCYLNKTKEIVSKTNEKFQMVGQFGCHTTGIIYLVTCSNCRKQYVGQTGRKFYDRVMEHLRYIKNGTKTLGLHFKENTCESKDMLVQVIEKVMPDTESLRLQRELYWIQKLDTMAPYGLNKRF